MYFDRGLVFLDMTAHKEYTYPSRSHTTRRATRLHTSGIRSAWEKGRQLKSFDNTAYTYNANGIRTSKTKKSMFC